MKRSLLAAVVAGLSLLAHAAAAQQTFTNLGGPWWFTISGKDRGAVVIQFSDPNGAMFLVQDIDLTDHPSFGFSRWLAAFFQIPAGEMLQLDSKRNIFGELELDDLNGGTDTLSIVKGKVNSTFTKMNLKGTIEGDSGPIAVNLKGVRPPDGFPVLSGGTNEGSIKGKGVSSKALDVSVLTYGALGPPAYEWTAVGPVAIDKVETSARLEGHIMLTPKFKAYGLLDNSPEFGVGPVQGKLNVPDPNTPIPKLGLNAQADRKLKLKGQLITPVDPVLQVTPTSFDFGGVRLDDPNATHTFLVKNVGASSLSGTATFLSSSDPDFEILGEDTYGPLEPNSPAAEIVVRFNPTATGAKTASLRFGVEAGLGSFVVPLKGTGGVPSISVDPPLIAFGDLSISATPVFKTITVTNVGDGALTGQATIENPTAVGVFTLHALLVDAVQTSISYTLAPGENTQFRIRFDPTTAGAASAQLGLSGAGATSVSITGNGTSP